MNNRTIHELLKKEVILYRDREAGKIYYSKDLYIPESRLHGHLPSFNGSPYIKAWILQYDPAGEIKLVVQPVPITMPEYGIWLTHNDEFFSKLDIQHIYL